MKFIQKITVAAIAMAGCAGKLAAQVEFKIERMQSSTYFKVSAVPQTDYPAPMNIVSTAQVTLKVPTGKFPTPDIINIMPDGQWQVNGRCNAPVEDPAYDYIYFGLKNIGTRAYTFSKDKETPLFLLKAGDQCAVKIQLVDNRNDLFFGKNSMAANIGNQMTILGAGGDAWVGNRDGGSCECFVPEQPDVPAGQIHIFPNPVNGAVVRFAFNRDEKDGETCDVLLYDIAGRLIHFEKIQPKTGYNEFTLNVSEYPIGMYQMEIRGLKLRPMYQQLVKSE